MDKEKQIEEMAKYLETIFPTKGIVGGIPIKIKHDYRAYAKLIYTAGYRNASEVAREIFEEIEKEIELALDSNCKVKRDAQDDNDSLVMYVEGKIDCLRGLLGFLAELKKKYTEEGK